MRLVAGLLLVLLTAACGAAPRAAPRDSAASAGLTPVRDVAKPTDAYAGLTAEDPHGRPIPFADFKGKVRVIDIWASWCGPCRMTIPELNILYDKYRDRGLVVVGISVDDSPADVLEFQHNVPMRYPTGMFNRGLVTRLGEPSSIPTTYLVDRQGVLRKTFVGYVDAETLENFVRRLL